MGIARVNFRAYFFVLACRKPVLDGFDQHSQATVLSPLSRAVDKSQQHQQFFPLKTFWERWESNPGQLGPEGSILPA